MTIFALVKGLIHVSGENEPPYTQHPGSAIISIHGQFHRSQIPTHDPGKLTGLKSNLSGGGFCCAFIQMIYYLKKELQITHRNMYTCI